MASYRLTVEGDFESPEGKTTELIVNGYTGTDGMTGHRYEGTELRIMSSAHKDHFRSLGGWYTDPGNILLHWEEEADEGCLSQGDIEFTLPWGGTEPPETRENPPAPFRRTEEILGELIAQKTGRAPGEPERSLVRQFMEQVREDEKKFRIRAGIRSLLLLASPDEIERATREEVAREVTG